MRPLRTCRLQRQAHHLLLAGSVGRSQAAGPSALVYGRAGQQHHGAAAAASLLQRLGAQQDQGACLGAHVAVGCTRSQAAAASGVSKGHRALSPVQGHAATLPAGSCVPACLRVCLPAQSALTRAVQRLAAPVGRQHAGALEHAGGSGGQHHVDAAGQRRAGRAQSRLAGCRQRGCNPCARAGPSQPALSFSSHACTSHVSADFCTHALLSSCALCLLACAPGRSVRAGPPALA